MKTPKECKDCPAFHVGAEGKYKSWCCHFGKPTQKSIGECRLIEWKKTEVFLYGKVS